jgi:nitrite reductase/ring-hydroxylating ferredoxin subunit/pyruvate/2-oxoglutarate dehydrogenase complex dihydrolipoamide dehydrogenase (E3) component
MAEQQPNPPGPDLTKGVSVADIAAGQMLLGHVNQDAVLLARQGDEFFAIGATCSHYSGPLAEGLMAGDTVRCPWHHARFSLRTGEAIGAPAFNALPCWRVEKSDDKVFVRERTAPADRSEPSKPARATVKPDRIVIVGGGAAGFAAAEMLRREGFGGSLTLVSADNEPPYDRPNCSKDYLAGSAPEDWMPLKPAEFYKEYSIDLQLGSEVTAIDSGPRQVALANGRKIAFDKLLLATGAEPVRLQREVTVTSIEGTNAKLKSGATLPAEVVVVGVGVRPRLQLAERAGVKIDRGVAVNEYLETSIPDIYAAGDIARWPDPHTGENLRIEHWVVAERQGQAVARNMLGQEQRFSEVPFFWSQHYDVPINYVGHAEKWDSVDIDGNIKSRDCLVRYRQNGKVLAVASIFRDIDSLKAEMSMEAR